MFYVLGPQFWDPFLAPRKVMILQIQHAKKLAEPSELASRNDRTRWADHDDHPKNHERWLDSRGSQRRQTGRQTGRETGRQSSWLIPDSFWSIPGAPWLIPGPPWVPPGSFWLIPCPPKAFPRQSLVYSWFSQSTSGPFQAPSRSFLIHPKLNLRLF